MVGASRFERPTSCSQGRRANQAALRPDLQEVNPNNQIPNLKTISNNKCPNNQKNFVYFEILLFGISVIIRYLVLAIWLLTSYLTHPYC
jgi:hypothetical protein